MSRAFSFHLITILLASILSAGPRTSESRVLRVVFSEQSFTSINRNDALASAKAWIESIGRRRGLELGVEVDTYGSTETLRVLVQEGGADLFIVSSMDYLALEAGEAPWKPVFIPQQGEFVLRDHVLLAKQGRCATPEDLRGGRVIFLLTLGARLGRTWLDTELAGRDLAPAEAFFGEAREAEKPSSAVLPVFFGKADACVVDRASFEIMQELNPQIGTVLGVCLSSPPYVETVICIHEDYQEHREDVLDGLAELHTDPAGQSLLTVFKINRLVAYSEELMTSVRALSSEAQEWTRGTVQ